MSVCFDLAVVEASRRTGGTGEAKQSDKKQSFFFFLNPLCSFLCLASCGLGCARKWTGVVLMEQGCVSPLTSLKLGGEKRAGRGEKRRRASSQTLASMFHITSLVCPSYGTGVGRCSGGTMYYVVCLWPSGNGKIREDGWRGQAWEGRDEGSQSLPRPEILHLH